MVVLGISTLSAGWQTFFFAVAIGLLLLASFGLKTPNERLRLDSLGLALFIFVFFWNALAAT
jgi:hypothetical protein